MFDFGQARVFSLRAHGANIGEIEHAAGGFFTHANNHFQIRKIVGLELAGWTVHQFRRQVLQHIEVMAGLELFCGNNGAAADFIQRILEFVQAVGRIDAHHDGADAGGGVLHQGPFAAVRTPDADPVTRFYAQGQQSGGQSINFPFEFGIGPAHILVAHDQCFVVRETLADMIEVVADGLVNNLSA